MFLPAVAGFWLGTGFLLVLAVTLHNIPEGMAVGIVYAGLMAQTPGITSGGALALSLGIAIQNFPEGAIISLPLHSDKGVFAFAVGFTLMMMLDVALG